MSRCICSDDMRAGCRLIKKELRQPPALQCNLFVSNQAELQRWIRNRVDTPDAYPFNDFQKDDAAADGYVIRLVHGMRIHSMIIDR